jgi:hypothetical protein
LLRKKQAVGKSKMQRDEILKTEKKTMANITRMERRGSELDCRAIPESDLLVEWREFNTDLKSSKKQITPELLAIIQAYS